MPALDEEAESDEEATRSPLCDASVDHATRFGPSGGDAGSQPGEGAQRRSGAELAETLTGLRVDTTERAHSELVAAG